MEDSLYAAGQEKEKTNIVRTETYVAKWGCLWEKTYQHGSADFLDLQTYAAFIIPM